MKKLPLLLILIVSLWGCDKAVDGPDFFNEDYRIGQWITPDKLDTLEFVDNTDIIRKGHFYTHEEYKYRIEGEYMYIKLPSSSTETSHRIIKARNNMVTIDNMYLTIGFAENFGTFFKSN